ncbi:pilus assembly-related outer membrane protein [Metapseudomonas resinovorans]|uniref:A24 family peptidase n=1 Tax=Metapseudomonas resinovorans TaxID=53412 RepID=UPI000987CEDB|nr:prepilin peptidase [Pseudomonas resinovorans]GLZ89055.1 pilus assembly-related outer membrane protein [Pseudomonas resinovorans]
MAIEHLASIPVLLGLLGIAVIVDLACHRIPNLLVLLGLGLGIAGQIYYQGALGLGFGVLGMLIGLAAFLPLYALRGMAAGDVKLMAMAGAFLAPMEATWAAAFSLMAGGLCGLVLVLLRGQLSKTLGRYWLMLRLQTYVAPEAGEVAGKPFPFAIAVLLGTLASVLWQPLGQ